MIVSSALESRWFVVTRLALMGGRVRSGCFCFRLCAEPRARSPRRLSLQGNLEFSFQVEVMPEFTLPELAGITVKKPTITVEGNCDPVGTSEYNMALGMRRAEAAKAYLVKLGVDAAQLATISYGEEKLVTQDEAQYEQNRRAEFKVAQ